MLLPEDFVSVHAKLPESQISFLETIDKNNQSNAVRTAIDRYKNQSRTHIIKDHLILFTFGVFIIIFATLLTNLLAIVVSVAIGLFCVFYGFLVLMRFMLEKRK